MGAHSLSPCIQFGPVVGLRASAWKRKCAPFLCMETVSATGWARIGRVALVVTITDVAKKEEGVYGS